MVVFSLLLNIALCVAISYRYFHQPEQQFYATNGVTAPMLLEPLDAPNNLSNALLPPDPLIMDQTKFIPQ